MSDDTIQFTLGDWQWNAALIGFINIIGEDNVDILDDTVKFHAEVLDGFEEKYFEYLIQTNEKTLSWTRIVSFRDKMSYYEENNFDNFDLLSLKEINTYIKDVKYFIESASYKAAYSLMDSELDILSVKKELEKIKEPKSQVEFDKGKSEILDDVKHVFGVLRQIIDYCDSPDGQRYIRAKNVIYSVIKNAWNGVCFLNPQTKEKDVYTNYKTDFVDAAVDYIQSEKGKYRFQCFTCDAPIKNMNNSMSFLNGTGFDANKKSSHVWNFENDVALCPVCKLIYSCLPAGMTYVGAQGLYVNANIYMQDALKINYKIKTEILQPGENHSAYYALVRALHENGTKAAKYQFVDVQVIRYENAKYRFNILSRKVLKIIMEHEAHLNSLVKTAFIENKLTFRVFDEVVDRLFNSQNLFTLIHKMLHYKLSNPSKCYFNGTHVRHLLTINQDIYQSLGGMDMDTKNYYLVKNAKDSGVALREKYGDKKANNKLPGICYRLLNALKTSNSGMFMDVVLNCYLYVKDQVPKVMTDVLGQEKEFSTMGYAFVAGLIEGDGLRINTAENVDRGEVE